MIYLDYSATTPVDEKVISEFVYVTRKYVGNPNSSHALGKEAKQIIDDVTFFLAKELKIKSSEIIYTSGASESNNLAIKGYCNANKHNGKHIITSEFEHSSVIAPISYLQKSGFEVDFIKLDKDGNVDLEHFKSIIKEDTILVSLSSINGELGIKTNLKDIKEILKSYPKIKFHVDMTQSLGKEAIVLDYADMAAFSAQKGYGFKGVGFLYKKDDVSIEPLIHGGRSTTNLRSGTPAIGLIASLKTTYEVANTNLDSKILYVKSLNNKIRTSLSNYSKVHINSPEDAICHILNISIKGADANSIMKLFERYEVYFSPQAACSLGTSPSRSVMALYNDIELASSSFRISLSHLTTEDEIDEFLEIFKKVYQEVSL
jgi:cysteine desulfurase